MSNHVLSNVVPVISSHLIILSLKFNLSGNFERVLYQNIVIVITDAFSALFRDVG